MSRARDRLGRHTSVAGDPAESTLRDLVSQFSDRYAFIRELIQNSLDAQAVAIDIDMSWSQNTLVVAVVDDGEGMDRATIEGYLLTLFRSTKEDDLTKIGKFGIGFVSLFAMEPKETWVDTGRDGIWHRVIFAKDRSWKLMGMDDPFEGTTVTLHIPCSRKEAQKHCEAIAASARVWCRFADAEIYTSASGIPRPWDPRPIRASFALHLPIVASGEGDGWRAIVGLTKSSPPPVCFVNQGLTLWDTRKELFPGVAVLAEGRHLEHTLTRDSVRFDRHFDAIIEKLKALTEGPLADAAHEALSAAADDPEALAKLLDAMPHRAPFPWREGDIRLPAVGREPVPLSDLRPRVSWLGRLTRKQAPATLWVSGDHPELAQAVAHTGQLVLQGGRHDGHILWAAACLGEDEPLAIHEVSEAWHMTRPAPDAPAASLISALQDWLPRTVHNWTLHSATFASGGRFVEGRLAVRETEPHTLTRHGTDQGDHVCIDTEHDLLQQLIHIPVEHACPLLLRAIEIELGIAGDLPDWLFPAEVAP